jgi:hypothetical protein
MKADNRTRKILSGVKIQSFMDRNGISTVSPLPGKCPVGSALKGGVKGHNIKGKYLTGKLHAL